MSAPHLHTQTQAIRFGHSGSAHALHLVDEILPPPAPSEVRVRIRYSALNRFEIMYRDGDYFYSPQFPSRIGGEAVGHIEAVGAAVVGFNVGDRVSILPSVNMIASGTHARHVNVDVQHLIPTPPELSDVDAAAIWLAWFTGYGPLVHSRRLGPGRTAVITAASSSSGIAGIQLARSTGATVIATTRTGAKRDRLRELGAHHVIATDDEDVTQGILSRTGGRGADVVYDPISGPMLPKLALATTHGGAIYVYGALQAGGTSDPLAVPFGVLAGKWLTTWLAMDVILNPVVRDAAIAHAIALYRAGENRPVIDRVFPLGEATAAQKHMEAGGQIGKILLAC